MSWLKRSVAAVKRNDPAARTTLEVLLTYPGLHALFWHRLSHFLYRHQLFLLAKIHAQFWRFITGVEIHPGATIGAGVFIDHGMGIVIGETAEIEEDVVLFHGVTLAQILGPVVIGERSKIGAGAVVISDIPADATAVGVPAKVVRLNGRKVEKGHD